MKTTNAPNSVKTAKKSLTSITRLTRFKTLLNSNSRSSEASYEAKVDINIGRLMDDIIEGNNGLADKNEVFKFLGRA